MLECEGVSKQLRFLPGAGMNDSIAVVAAKIGKRASGRQFGEPKRTATADDFIAARPIRDVFARS